MNNFTEQVITIAKNGILSSGFVKQKWANFIGVFVPSLVNGIMYLKVTRDAGTTKFYVKDSVDGESVAALASGQDPGFIDITDFLRPVGRALAGATEQIQVYVETAATQTSGATIYVWQKE